MVTGLEKKGKVCVGGALVMNSESGEGESVVEDDWSEGMSESSH